MIIRNNTIAAAVAVLALSTSLVACAPSAEPTPSQPPAYQTESAEPNLPIRQSSRVEVVEILSPTVFIVTPLEKEDPLYGNEIIAAGPYAIAPEKGECGYEEALAFTTEFIESDDTGWFHMVHEGAEENWINADGEHVAPLRPINSLTNSDKALIEAGFAGTTQLGKEHYASTEDQAREDGIGLWEICPSYGSE